MNALAQAAAVGAGGWTIEAVIESILEEVLLTDTPPELVRRDAASLQGTLERSV